MPTKSQSTDDVLFFDAEGYLVESSIWAIGWWDRETLVFPPLALGGLPSVARARRWRCLAIMTWMGRAVRR